jgi:ribosomal protein S18 acetylase RimI-like enzyme
MNASDGAPRDFALRVLTPADVTFAAELNALIGWNQTERDWRGYLEFAPDGCFVADVAGQRAGTATTIAYGDRFGWVGMVLVRPEFRRLGLGTTLLRHTIDFLRSRGTGCVKLDATPMGRPVYLPLGFVDEYEVSRYQVTAAGAGVGAAGAAEETLQPLAEADFSAVVRLDAAAFGAERPAVLRAMSGRDPEMCFAVSEAGRIRGYAIARQGREAVQLGPWIAEDPETAERLLGAVLARVAGRRVFVDVPHPNAAGRALVERHGFTVQRGFMRMFLGENRHPGAPEKVYGTSGAEKG